MLQTKRRRSLWRGGLITGEEAARLRTGNPGGAPCAQAVFTVLLFMACVHVLGCAAGRPTAPTWNHPATSIVWPLPPEEPRIAYAGSIRSGEDIGIRPSFIERATGLLFGQQPRTMVKPVAVAKNEAGLLVVTDPAVPTVHFFDLRRRRYRRLAARLARSLRSPVGVAVDESGRVYVTDSLRRAVFVLGGPRTLVRVIGEGLLERPTGIALSPDGRRVYVVDTLAAQVVIFDTSGTEISRFGTRGTEPGGFNFPTYISVAPDGTLVISDSLNFRIQTFLPSGTPVRTFGTAGNSAGTFARPKGVAVDALGRVYVVDAAFENVQLFDAAGNLLLAFGSAGTAPGQLYLPTGIFVDSNMMIWVADSFNKRVEVFRLLESKP